MLLGALENYDVLIVSAQTSTQKKMTKYLYAFQLVYSMVLVGKPTGKKTFGRLRRRCDNIKIDQEVGCERELDLSGSG